MLDVRELREIQLDALREVANIGAGHAATALSEMTGARIEVSVPRLQIALLEEVPDLIGDPDEVVAAILMHVQGELTARTLLIFPRSSAIRLAEILLRRATGSCSVFDELEQSSLKEAGNILAAAYMNALSDFVGGALLPSVPSLVIDLCAAVLTTVYTTSSEPRDYAFSIETQFAMSGESEPVKGHFLLLPDVDSLPVLLESLRLT